MPANPDHIRRDAEHAARMEIVVFLEKFKRRMYEEAKAHIGEDIARGGGGILDGTAIGRAAAARAVAAYGAGDPIEPVEHRAIEDTTGPAGEDPRLRP